MDSNIRYYLLLFEVYQNFGLKESIETSFYEAYEHLGYTFT